MHFQKDDDKRRRRVSFTIVASLVRDVQDERTSPKEERKAKTPYNINRANNPNRTKEKGWNTVGGIEG